MVLYYFNTAVDGRSMADTTGLDLHDDTAAREIAVRIALRMADLPHDACEAFVYVSTEGGKLVFKIPFGSSEPITH